MSASSPAAASNRRAAFPIGARVTLTELSADPYPAYARLREHEPVSWIDELGMYFVTSADLVRAVLLDDRRFTTSSPHSLIQDTFGANMLTTDGAPHVRYRRPFRSAFMPPNIRTVLEPSIGRAVDGLVEGFGAGGEAELRAQFASRLPVQTILLAFGLPIADEPLLRNWYDAFERALSNFARDPAASARGHAATAEFDAYLDRAMDRCRANKDELSLLGSLVHASGEGSLDDDGIKRNLAIIFFGGISTVEALILNASWALAHHQDVLQRVIADATLIPGVLDETMRWLSPVQSATRHVVHDTELGGVMLHAGDTVNCMIAAANHDPLLFPEPGRFDIGRPNLAQHLGFATGPHLCLGFRLAKAEARIALQKLLVVAPGLEIVRARTSAPEGHEFRQPRRLTIALGA